VHSEGIGVTVVHPGAIKTAIMDEAARSADYPEEFAKTRALVDKIAMPADKAANCIKTKYRKDADHALRGGGWAEGMV